MGGVDSVAAEAAAGDKIRTGGLRLVMVRICTAEVWGRRMKLSSPRAFPLDGKVAGEKIVSCISRAGWLAVFSASKQWNSVSSSGYSSTVNPILRKMLMIRSGFG